jgi:hypothetical protein
MSKDKLIKISSMNYVGPIDICISLINDVKSVGIDKQIT